MWLRFVCVLAALPFGLYLFHWLCNSPLFRGLVKRYLHGEATDDEVLAELKTGRKSAEDRLDEIEESVEVRMGSAGRIENELGTKGNEE